MALLSRLIEPCAMRGLMRRAFGKSFGKTINKWVFVSGVVLAVWTMPAAATTPGVSKLDWGKEADGIQCTVRPTTVVELVSPYGECVELKAVDNPVPEFFDVTRCHATDPSTLSVVVSTNSAVPEDRMLKTELAFYVTVKDAEEKVAVAVCGFYRPLSETAPRSGQPVADSRADAPPTYEGYADSAGRQVRIMKPEGMDHAW